MANVPFIQLNDGNRMPAIGLGTCAVSYISNLFYHKKEKSDLIFLISKCNSCHIFFPHNKQSNGNEIEKAVKDAIDVGYRHIDTAWAYENESSIGKAVRSKIADGTIKRSDMFIVTKVKIIVVQWLNDLKGRKCIANFSGKNSERSFLLFVFIAVVEHIS